MKNGDAVPTYAVVGGKRDVYHVRAMYKRIYYAGKSQADPYLGAAMIAVENKIVELNSFDILINPNGKLFNLIHHSK